MKQNTFKDLQESTNRANSELAGEPDKSKKLFSEFGWLAFATILLLFPPIMIFTENPSFTFNGVTVRWLTLTATIVNLSVALLLWCFPRQGKAQTWARSLSVAFTLLALGDVLAYVVLDDTSIKLLLDRFAGYSYSAFMVIFSLLFVRLGAHWIRNQPIRLISTSLLSLLYFGLEIAFRLTPMFTSNMDLWSIGYQLIYAASEAVVFGFALSLSFTATRWSQAAFFNGTFFLCVCDFALWEADSAIWSLGWYYATIVIGSTLVFHLGSILKKEENPLRINSLFFYMTIGNLAGSLILIGYLLISGLMRVTDAAFLSQLLFAFFIIWLLAFFTAFYFSRTLQQLANTLDEHQKDFEPVTKSLAVEKKSPNSTASIDLLQRTAGISEIDDILDRYNRLVTYANSLLRELEEQARAKAIASLTQMLAHDVRKPFSTLKLGLHLLKSARTPADMQNLITTVSESVTRSIITVNGLLSDITEIGKTAPPILEPVCIETVLNHVLLEVFQVFEDAQISIKYSLEHRKGCRLLVEDIKVYRVFSNILANAVQAMKKKGTLTIVTREREMQPQFFLEFIIGNSGPEISPESLTSIFEAFYSRGKRGGTGLGLAIAQKVVTEHEGKIWCESPGEQMPVEFHFLLPAVLMSDDLLNQKLNTKLPNNSTEAYGYLKMLGSPDAISSRDEMAITDPREIQFRDQILSTTSGHGRPLQVVVIDDDLIFREGILSLLRDDSTLLESISLTTFATGTLALSSPNLSQSDLIICDVDLGNDSIDGYEIIHALRGDSDRRFCGVLCIHSNRSLPEDFKRAIDAGADTVFPKPMTRAHLMQILAQAAANLCHPRYR